MAKMSDEYVRWVEECQARKSYIEKAKALWKARVLERNRAVDAWDRYVEEAREQLKYARSFPAPKREVAKLRSR